MRFDEDDTQTTIVDQWITADQAIDALIFAQSLDRIAEIEEVDGAEDEDDEAAEDDEEPQPDQKASVAREVQGRGRRAEYDKDALTDAIRNGVRSTQELAEEFGVTSATIYQIRNKLKHADATAVADETPATTAYAIRQKERAEVPASDTNIEGEIKLAAMQGFSVSEIGDMYPMVPLETIAKLKAEANR